MTSSDQQHFIVACAVKQIAETQTALSNSDSDQVDAGTMSSRSNDGNDDGMLGLTLCISSQGSQS